MIKEVKFRCPECGIEWNEEQDTEDEWFGLGTANTLCEECGRQAIARLKEEWDVWGSQAQTGMGKHNCAHR